MYTGQDPSIVGELFLYVFTYKVTVLAADNPRCLMHRVALFKRGLSGFYRSIAYFMLCSDFSFCVNALMCTVFLSARQRRKWLENKNHRCRVLKKKKKKRIHY